MWHRSRMGRRERSDVREARTMRASLGNADLNCKRMLRGKSGVCADDNDVNKAVSEFAMLNTAALTKNVLRECRRAKCKRVGVYVVLLCSPRLLWWNVDITDSSTYSVTRRASRKKDSWS
jgi:hypothetical protein